MAQKKISKSLFYLYFLTLGLVSSLLQMTLLREVLIVFRGNELFLSYFLLCWLVLIGIGSLVSTQKLKIKSLAVFFSFYYLIVSFLMFGFFLCLRILPQILHFSYEIPNLLHSLIYLPLMLLPVAFLLGIGFSWGNKYFDYFISSTTSLNVNQAYLTETFGFFVGSLFFNFWLVKIITFKLILLLIIFSLLVNLLMLMYNYRYKLLKIFWLSSNIIVILLVAYLALTQAKIYEIKTANWKMPKEKLILSHNSFLGNIIVTEKQDQYNFYEQGSLIAPSENFQTSEELIHLPLSFTQKPKKILIIGRAWNGELREALKYPNLEIFYVEIDPQFLPLITDYLSPEQQKELQNPRVKIITQDAFSYLKKTREKFDFILSNLPAPTTYQTNRYYTKEFFNSVKENLTSQGVLAITLPFYQENLDNPNINQFIYSIFNPFKQVFENNVLAPSYNLILIGLKDKNFEWQARDIAQNFKEKNISTNFLSPDYIEYLLTNERKEQILTQIKKYPTPANTQWAPIAVIYRIISQIEMRQPKISQILNWFITYRWLGLGLLLILPLLLVYLFKRRAKNNWQQNKIKLIVCFVSSLSMVLEITLIFIWQSTIGYLYYYISLIIALTMLGIFLANLQLYLRPIYHKTKALKNSLFFLLFLSIFLLIYLLALNYYSISVDKIILLGLALIFGYSAGRIYPLANYLYLEKKLVPQEETGKIYGLELLGGGILLIIFSLFILPFLGLLALAGFLIYWVGLNLFLAKDLGSEDV